MEPCDDHDTHTATVRNLDLALVLVLVQLLTNSASVAVHTEEEDAVGAVDDESDAHLVGFFLHQPWYHVNSLSLARVMPHVVVTFVESSCSLLPEQRGQA